MTPTISRRPYDTFRPVTGAWVAGAMAVASAVVFVLVAVLPGIRSMLAKRKPSTSGAPAPENIKEKV